MQAESIPNEQTNYVDRPSSLSSKTISLLKNNWLDKTGLLSLLGSGSDVPEVYRLLQTVRGSFNLVWQADKSPQELGDPLIKAAIASSGELQFKIPGTLEYNLKKSPEQTTVAITGGIHPWRLAGFKFKGLDRFRDPRNFTLLDEANLLPELKSVQLTIGLYRNNSKAKEISYLITPSQTPEGLTVWGNLYKVNLKDVFNPWLQTGQAVQYDIQVKQITRSGASYTSGMKIDLTVDRVTASPPIKYYANADTCTVFENKDKRCPPLP